MSGIVLVRLKWRVFCWSTQQCWSDVCVRYRIGPFEVECSVGACSSAGVMSVSGIVLVRLKWRVFYWSTQQCWSDVCVRYRIGPFEVESVLLEHAAVLE